MAETAFVAPISRKLDETMLFLRKRTGYPSKTKPAKQAVYMDGSQYYHLNIIIAVSLVSFVLGAFIVPVASRYFAPGSFNDHEGALIASNEAAVSKDLPTTTVSAPPVVDLPANRQDGATVLPNTERRAGDIRLASYLAERFGVDEDAAYPLQSAATLAGQKHGIEPTLLLAIAGKATAFHPFVKSRIGEVGLMKILPKMHMDQVERLKREGRTLVSVEGSFDAGAEILNEYRQSYNGDLNKALQRINGTLADTTQSYAKSVTAEADKMARLLEQR